MRNQAGFGWLVPAFLAVALCSGAGPASAENIDPDGDGHQYAWGENIGWVNAEPSGDGGPGIQVGDFALTGWMWGENTGWISLSCENTLTCSNTSYEVANNGNGVLSGFAWSENVGWVNLRPTACAGDPTCGVQIDPATGYFNGRAWGENTGWISFSSGPPTTSTARTSWCQSTPAAPGTAFTLTASKSGAHLLLEWTALSSAGWFDVVGGRISTLRGDSGNFASATETCHASNLAASSHLVTDPPPAAGDALWFLVRGANCKGNGSYDSGGPSQQQPRDLEIAASGNDCP